MGAAAEGDPFADVKGRIRGIIDALRAEGNKDTDMTTFCAEQAQAFQRDQVRKKDEVDLASSLIQLHESMESELKDESSAAVTISAENLEGEKQQADAYTKRAEIDAAKK